MSTTEATRVRVRDVSVGDQVGRQLVSGEGAILWLTVTDVDDTLIHCNRWQFDRESGAEVDDDLKWGPAHGKSGAFIVQIIRAVV